MANDGQVIIDVELNSDKAVREAEQISRKIGDSFDRNVNKSINEVEKNVSKISTAFGRIKVGDLSKEFSRVDNSINKTNAYIDKQKQKLEDLKKAYDKADSTNKQNNIQQQMRNTELSISRAERQLEKLSNRRLNLNNLRDAGNGLDGSFSSASVKITNDLDKIEKKAEETGKKLKESLNPNASLTETGEKINTVGSSISSAGDKLTTHLTLPIIGLGIAAGKIGMDFDSQMSRVKAISGATGQEFDKLHDQALQLGADTAFSARHTWHTTKKFVA